MFCFPCSHLLPRQPTQYSALQSYWNSAEERFRSCHVSQRLSFPFEGERQRGRNTENKMTGQKLHEKSRMFSGYIQCKSEILWYLDTK